MQKNHWCYDWAPGSEAKRHSSIDAWVLSLCFRGRKGGLTDFRSISRLVWDIRIYEMTNRLVSKTRAKTNIKYQSAVSFGAYHILHSLDFDKHLPVSFQLHESFNHRDAAVKHHSWHLEQPSILFCPCAWEGNISEAEVIEGWGHFGRYMLRLGCRP